MHRCNHTLFETRVRRQGKMVLLLINIALKEDHLSGDLNRLDELLSSLEDQEGYCTHTVNRELKRVEQLLLIIEWENEVTATAYLDSEAFKLLVETIKKVGAHYSSILTGVLSRGEIEIVREQISSPSILEASQD